ncbi:radical SAM protein [Paenibacillus sp. GP183]|jgi:DNA repair photolyase|uniref:SPL family radical SAM protein n=1 Tax=Paenibacillus sp. GP183 TaxID=1882751 RepID=UPI000894E912|nr:radical SAM protein [Paenibacillus sp. GP183]SEC68321.1 DNA repair photolyase [Paenibacillus sp. GP183]
MSKSTQYEAVSCKTILNEVKAPSMPFEKSINPYRGCLHGCSFCYARSTHSFLGMEGDDTFQKHILLKSNAAEALEAEVLKQLRPGKRKKPIGRIAIGTATDPYQPIEGKMKLTRECLKVAAKYQLTISITTRSPLVLRDIDILKEIPITSVNLSINTLNPNVWRSMEPSTPSPMKRLETVQQLIEAGIPAGIFMAPILPYLTDSPEDLHELIQQASTHRAEFVMANFLRLSTREVKVWFFQNLQIYYPELVMPYSTLYGSAAHAPASYREPIRKQIGIWLEQYQLSAYKAYEAEKPAGLPVNPAQETDPVQLSFSFL